MDYITQKAQDLVSGIKTEIANKPDISVFGGEKALEELQRLNIRYGNGLTTGYEELDNMFTLLPQQLYLVSASTHTGKTTFCLNICARVASLGEPVLFCSLEQGVFIADRVVNMVGSFPEKLSILTSNSMLGIKDLTDYVANMEEKPKLVCIDHLHFIKKKGNKVTQDIDDMMAEIQNMSKKLEIPVIVISHVRKLNEDKAPTLDDLRDSSSLSQIPSVVLLLHRPKNEGEALKNSILSEYGALIIAKNRIQGKTGAIKFQLRTNGVFDFYKEVSYETAKAIFTS